MSRAAAGLRRISDEVSARHRLRHEDLMRCRRPQHVTFARHEAMLCQYEAGHSIRLIADWWDCPVSSVHSATASARKRRAGTGASGSITPVRIRGVEYPSAAEAARILGVRHSTVATMLASGREDLIGTGRRRKGRRQLRGHPVVIGPLSWPSQRAAAAELGLSQGHLNRVLRTGRLDLILPHAMRLAARRDAEVLAKGAAA